MIHLTQKPRGMNRLSSTIRVVREIRGSTLALRKAHSAAAVFSCLILMGCSNSDAPRTAPVKGTVTMAGKPLPNVGVSFLPEGKGPIASGNTNDKGEFVLMTNAPGDGAPIGTHKVTIGSAEEGPPKSGAARVPDKYGRLDTTDLTAEVKDGQTNVFNFDLKP